MTIRELFAKNLRALCSERGTIAKIEREVGIGRVQISRYLKGTLPSEENLRLLAEFFEMDETFFFQSNFSNDAELNDNQNLKALLPTVHLLEREPAPRIADGAYYLYFLAPDQRGVVVRSSMFIRRDNGLTKYRSFTREVMHEGENVVIFKSLKRGLVFERYGSFYFVSLNHRGPREPALGVATWLPISLPFLSGHALVMHSTFPMSLRFVAHMAPKTESTADIVRQCGFFPIDEVKNGGLIKRLLASQVDTQSVFSV